jgi:hypothetical protein
MKEDQDEIQNFDKLIGNVYDFTPYCREQRGNLTTWLGILDILESLLSPDQMELACKESPRQFRFPIVLHSVAGE